jgi:hypothetical protein
VQCHRKLGVGEMGELKALADVIPNLNRRDDAFQILKRYGSTLQRR